MDKRLIINLMRWILRIIATVLCAFFIFFMFAHFFEPASGSEYVFLIRDIIMFIGMFSMVIGFGIIWFNELVSGLMVVLGYLVFSITNSVTGRSFFTGLTTLIFVIVGLLILLLWFLERNLKKEK